MSKDLQNLLDDDKMQSLIGELDLTREEYRTYVSDAYVNYRKVLPNISKFRGRVKMHIVLDKRMKSFGYNPGLKS